MEKLFPLKKMVGFTKEQVPEPIPPRSPPAEPLSPPRPVFRCNMLSRGPWWSRRDRSGRGDIESPGTDSLLRRDVRPPYRRREWIDPVLRTVAMASLCLVCLSLVVAGIVACFDWGLRGAGRKGILPRFAWA